MEEIAGIVTDGASREQKAERVADAVRASGGYRWVGIYDVTPEEVAIVAWSGAGSPAYPRFPRTQGITGAAVAARETVVVGDVASDPRYLEAFGDTRSELIVPVLVDGEVRGTIDVESERPHAFAPEDRARIEACAAAARPLWL